jgi:CubicO group peptidase (beta-lactamase class C family)
LTPPLFAGILLRDALHMRILLLLGCAICALSFSATARAEAKPSLANQLEVIRAKYNVPALGGAIFTTDGLQEIAVTGVRKRGDPTPATKDDLWHLGSDTKAMTAALLGTYVAEGKIRWDDKVTVYFPEIASQIPAANRDVTLTQILEHKAGLPANLPWGERFLDAFVRTDSLVEERRAAARRALLSPAYLPGAFHYSNCDYVVIGAIVEKIGGRPWEDLLRERIFQPLGMTSPGFGGLGTPGRVDQPWPHNGNGDPMPANGPAIDNPPVMGPAGTIHCTMTDWSKFLVDQLRGGCGEKALLPPEIYQAMQTDPASKGDGYAFGWGVCPRDWAGGKALNHAGSNTMNFCDAWLAPAKKFGVLVVCNQGGDAAAKAADDACFMLIQRHQAAP